MAAQIFAVGRLRTPKAISTQVLAPPPFFSCDIDWMCTADTSCRDRAAWGSKEKLCIFAGAQKLPSIPGLAIIRARTSELPANLRSTAGAHAGLMVKIAIKAISTDATFDFVCVSPVDNPAVAMPVGLSR
jgi:hypothetical protein